MNNQPDEPYDLSAEEGEEDGEPLGPVSMVRDLVSVVPKHTLRWVGLWGLVFLLVLVIPGSFCSAMVLFGVIGLLIFTSPIKKEGGKAMSRSPEEEQDLEGGAAKPSKAKAAVVRFAKFVVRPVPGAYVKPASEPDEPIGSRVKGAVVHLAKRAVGPVPPYKHPAQPKR